MQISTKFTIAIHVLTAVEYFSKDYKVTSEFLAGSVGSNPVIIRNIMLQLKDAGLIEIKRGPGGIHLLKPLNEITFLDVYKAVETSSHEDLFRFHENPNPQRQVGRNPQPSADNTRTAHHEAAWTISCTRSRRILRRIWPGTRWGKCTGRY